MKSDIDIKDEIYNLLKGSELAQAVTGEVYKTRRPKNSTKEDIIIAVVANEGSQKQEAVVNVNVYVEDNVIDGQPEEDTIRCRELADIAKSVLQEVHINGAWVRPSPPRVFEAQDIPWHIINNKLSYKFLNE